MKFKEANTLADIAEILQCRLIGNSAKIINGINRIEDADENDITFLADEKYAKYLSQSKAGCIIIGENFDTSQIQMYKNLLVCADPRKSFNTLLVLISERKKQERSSFIHPSSHIGDNCEIHPTVYIAPHCTIGDNCTIGANTVIMPGTVISNYCKIGSNTYIYSNVSIYEECEIGNNCIIHSGAVIGADGFGFQENPGGSYSKIPQLGNVIIQNDVEIGANTTVDRAILGSTIIENGVKIDNLVQIAHNVLVGENTAIASQTGISGSTKIGKRNRIAGQCGFAGHITTSDDVILMAKSGVAKSIEAPGTYFGSPARERMKAFKIEAVINNLPQLKQEIKQLSDRVEELENK